MNSSDQSQPPGDPGRADVSPARAGEAGVPPPPARFFLNCRQAVRAQSEALDQPLSPARRFGLWLHLLLCRWCRRYGRQIRFLRDAARDYPDVFSTADSPALSPAARDRIKQRLRSEK
jgi:hypothetical protein